MNSDVAAQLENFAASDLRVAKREGHMLIGQTKRGTLTLTHSGGVYTLAATDGVIASGKPAAVRPVLAGLYTVTNAEDRTIEAAVRSYERACARHGGAEAWDARKEGRPRSGATRSRPSSGGRPNNYTGD